MQNSQLGRGFRRAGGWRKSLTFGSDFFFEILIAAFCQESLMYRNR